jgi:hypothetical protein
LLHFLYLKINGISNKADFSTHTYQQDFHVVPDPKKTIQLGVLGKQGRYVRIQLLDPLHSQQQQGWSIYMCWTVWQAFQALDCNRK